jgi:D-alanine-D-alanine ligase
VSVAPHPVIRVAVLMGGISSEHAVSLVSGCGILANLDPTRYRGFPVLISRSNEWIWPGPGAETFSETPLQPSVAATLLQNPPPGWRRVLFPRFDAFPEAEIFFLGLHGIGGEDGRLQGFLEMAGQPFTGSGSLGSSLAMDKIISKQLYAASGIPTAPWVVLEPHELSEVGVKRVEQELGLPAVVKDPTGGSSLGVAVVRTREELLTSLRDLGQSGGGEPHRLLVEAFLPGREATCGVLVRHENEEMRGGEAQALPPLPPTEIRPKQDAFFTFEAKYQPGLTEEITPASFPAEVLTEMQMLARRCHDALQLSIYSRTDFIWTAKGLFALETNNLPGFTPTSIIPQQAAHIGMSYRELLNFILEESLQRWHAL